MNQQNPPTGPGNTLRNIMSLAPAAILLVIALALWRNHTETNDRLTELSVQNGQLQQELADAQAVINELNSGDSSQETRERLAAQRAKSTSEPQPEKAETLVLQAPTTTLSEEGISVGLAFESTSPELPGSVALIVRIPVDSDSRIMALEPTNASQHGDLKVHIDARGKFAVIEGTPTTLAALQYNLTVSAPTKVVVQGTSGIKGFELQISREQTQSRTL